MAIDLKTADLEWVREQINLIVDNDEQLLKTKDFVLRGAYRQELKGKFDSMKLILAMDRHCVIPAIKYHNNSSDECNYIKAKKADRLNLIVTPIVLEAYQDYKKKMESQSNAK